MIQVRQLVKCDTRGCNSYSDLGVEPEAQIIHLILTRGWEVKAGKHYCPGCVLCQKIEQTHLAATEANNDTQAAGS